MATGNDSASRDTREPGRPAGTPRLRSARARRVTYRTPRRFVVDGREELVHDVIEIDVETTGDFPTAGTGPALLVGDVAFTESERIGPGHYRFFGRATVRPKENAPIGLGRAGTGVPRVEHRTKLRLRWVD